MEGNAKWLSDDTPSEYSRTWEGQLEFWVMQFLVAGMRRHGNQFPPFWFGAHNAMLLYVIHPSYSPFVNGVHIGKPGEPKRLCDWDMTNVPEDQKHLVDENFLPIIKKVNQ